MAKKITKAQEEYITLHYNELSAEQIAEDTGCSLPTVKSRVKTLKAIVEKNEEVVEPVQPEPAIEKEQPAPVQEEQKESTIHKPRGNPMVKNSFGYGGKTLPSGGHQATIMTPGAADICDAVRKAVTDKKTPPHIHKPMG